MSTILFSSESPSILEPLGQITTTSLLFYDESVGLNISAGGLIDLSGVDQDLLEELVYLIPKRGRINLLTVRFLIKFAFFITEPIQIHAQAYTSFNSVFIPVSPPITLGSITTPVYAAHRPIYEIKSVNIPVLAGEKVFIAFYATSPSTIVTDIIGYSRAEITIKEEIEDY